MPHKNLIVLTDHKSLVGFLNSPHDKETDNRRMWNLRRKTENYRFTTQYTPGNQIGATDGISRREPQQPEDVPTKNWAEVNQATVDNKTAWL